MAIQSISIPCCCTTNKSYVRNKNVYNQSFMGVEKIPDETIRGALIECGSKISKIVKERTEPTIKEISTVVKKKVKDGAKAASKALAEYADKITYY